MISRYDNEVMKKLLFLILIFTLQTVHAYEFKVISWNVYMLPSPLKKSLQKTRTAIIPGKLRQVKFDLIFLQEAFMKSFRMALLKKLKTTHPHTYYLKSPSFPVPVFGSGLYVVSKFPVKLLDHIYFQDCRNADCLAAKGAALIEITLPQGQRVHVVNTHMQASESAGPIRMKQIRAIHRMLLRHHREDVPQFLIGDLNIDFNDPEFMLGLNLLGMDYARLTGPVTWTSGRTNPCFKVSPGYDWVDHMWFNNYPGISATSMQVRDFSFRRRGVNCPLSDHHAIEASFRF